MVLEQVSKRYTPHGPWALQGITLEIPQGAAVVLLGPKGAGKTTFLKLGLGILFPTEGRVTVLGTADLEAVRDQMGYLPQRADYPAVFTAGEYLRWLGRIRGLPKEDLDRKVPQILSRVGLSSHAEERIADFSREMLQQVSWAQVLLADPQVVFLDEPAAHLDSEGPVALEGLIRELCAGGTTCLLTSRRLEEAVPIATYIGLLKEGLLIDFREWSAASVPEIYQTVLEEEGEGN